MPINWMPAAADYLRFLPEIILTLAGTLLMVIPYVLVRSMEVNGVESVNVAMPSG